MNDQEFRSRNIKTLSAEMEKLQEVINEKPKMSKPSPEILQANVKRMIKEVLGKGFKFPG